MASQHHHHHHDHHDHHDHHGSEQSQTNSDAFTDKNRKHWDQAASTYSNAQWQKDIINKTHAFILSNIDWIGVDFLDPSTSFEKDNSESRQVKVLDYACGPGTITTILQGYATDFVGVDLSENMVKAYNAKFTEIDEQNESNTQRAKAFVGDLLNSRGPSDSVSADEFFGFSLAVVGFGFHHFQDLDLATSRLVSRLKPGGVLLIVDFATHAKEGGHPAQNTIAHHGFGEDEVKRIFGHAGLIDIGVLEMECMVEMKRGGAGDDGQQGFKRKVFMARGSKPL